MLPQPVRHVVSLAIYFSTCCPSETRLGKQFRIFQQALEKNLPMENPDDKRPEENNLCSQHSTKQHGCAQQGREPSK